MGFFSRFFSKRKTVPEMPDIQIGPMGIGAGILVTPERALNYSAVYRATALISQTIGFLPWSVYRDFEVQQSHDVHYLLHSRPNPEVSAMCFKETMIRDALLWGNGYAEIEFARNGNVRALWRLHPGRMTVLRHPKTNEIIYQYFASNGEMAWLPVSRIFHLKGLGTGLIGDSIVGYAHKSIAAGIAAEESSNKMVENQFVPAGVLKHPQKLAPDVAERLQNQFLKRYSGIKNAGRVLMLEEGMTFEPMSVKPEDAQFLDSRKFGIEEIARWFGIPPHKLADLEHATFSNIEHQSQEFVNDALMPWCKKLEEEADYKLLRNRTEKCLYTKIDVRGLLRGDNKSRMEYYKGGVISGIFSINDCRAWEDLPAIPGGDGHFVQAQMVPVSIASEGKHLDKIDKNLKSSDDKNDNGENSDG